MAKKWMKNEGSRMTKWMGEFSESRSLTGWRRPLMMPPILGGWRSSGSKCEEIILNTCVVIIFVIFITIFTIISIVIVHMTSKDVRLPVQLQRAMAAEAEAAREARAKVIIDMVLMVIIMVTKTKAKAIIIKWQWSWYWLGWWRAWWWCSWWGLCQG